MNHLWDNLKEFRIQKGWNQSQMADYLEISVRSYYDIEKTGEVKKSGVLAVIKDKTGITDSQLIAKEHAESYLTLRNKLKTKGEKNDVPVFNGSTSLGNMEEIEMGVGYSLTIAY
jgi:DNA-binding XRE family transcriptional regulator